MIELLTGTYGIGMSLAPLLQARRMRQRGSSQDVSMPYLAILLGGFVLYLAYGLSISNRVLVVTNVVSAIVTSTTLFIAWRLRPPRGVSAADVVVDRVAPVGGSRP